MESDSAAEGFTAMGSTARLEVLRALVRAGRAGRPVSEIQAALGIPASTLTHHLKVLADAGLIIQEKSGRSIISRANYDQLAALAAFILSECCSEEGRNNV